MKKKWIKRIIIILLIPFVLLFIVAIGLYIPAVQNFIQKKASIYASEATDLDISIGRVNLYFPLDLVVRDVQILEQNDTILALDKFNVSAQFWPLFRGKVELDVVTLENAKVNTKSLLDGMHLEGTIGRADLVSRGVDLNENLVRINQFKLFNSNIALTLADTTSVEKPDSISEPLDWRIKIDKVGVENLNFKLKMPLDSMEVGANIGLASIQSSLINLQTEQYDVDHFSLGNSSVQFKNGVSQLTKGFNPSDIRIADLNVVVDSIRYSEVATQAKITSFNMVEKSGLTVNRLQGDFSMNPEMLSFQKGIIQTAYSNIKLDVLMPQDFMNTDLTSQVNASMSLSLKEIAGILGFDIKKGNFETWGPVSGAVQLKGNTKKIDVQDLRLELEDSFYFTAVGSLFNVLDENKRQGQLDILGDFYDLRRFNPWLSDDQSVLLPEDLIVRGMVAVNDVQVYSELELQHLKSTVNLLAKYDLKTEKYDVKAGVDSLDVHVFLPELPIKNVIVDLSTKGQYLDFFSKKAYNTLHFNLTNLTYEDWSLRQITADADLKSEVLSAVVNSNNAVVKGNVTGKYYLNKPHISFNGDLNIDELDLYKLKIVDIPVDRVVRVKGDFEGDGKQLNAHFSSDDFTISVEIDNSVEDLMKRSDLLVNEFIKQLEAHHMDYHKIQKLLPTATISWNLGNDNIISSILKANSVVYGSSNAKIKSDPMFGIDGLAIVKDFKVDTLTLDTLSLKILQDSTRMELKAGLVNKFAKKPLSIASYATVTLKETDASLLLEFDQNKKEKGLLFGLNVEAQKQGLLFTLIPENPIIGFKRFSFKGDKNKLFLRDDLRLFAEVDMMEDRSVGFRMQSNVADSISRQNMNVELRRLDLSELVNLFPFLPDIRGFVSAESHYIQTDQSLQLSTDIFVDSLTYEKRSVGDFALGVTWLPISSVEDLVDVYMSHNRTDVLYADGNRLTVDGKEILDVNATLTHFPISVANVIFPDEEIKLSGDLDGQLHISGPADALKINGELILDSVSVYARQADAYFLFDSRPVKVVDSKIIFKDFSIYTTSDNPFKINGTVDISDLSNPIVDLKLNAKNYTLLNAKRRKESLVYGKLFVDFNATVKGAISALKLRGAMSILDNTNVTYVLTESPLTVQDRLGDLVTFTSFNDSTTTQANDSVGFSLGGIDMVMAVHIDPSVMFKVDLSADRSSRVELQGGGDLSLQYNPQTDLTLIGRYTLSDGIIKYALPIIPSKEFKVTSDSYIEWTGKIDDPRLNLRAKDRVRASVAESDGSSHMVNFDVIIGAKNKLENLELVFDLEAPESSTVQNQLATMSKEERNKQAIGMLATGVYLAGGGDGKGGLNMGAALNSVLQSQINSLAGSSLKNASLSVGVEEYDVADTGGKRTDYSFSYAQRFMNNRIQIVIGGRVKTGEEVSNDLNSFIDNVSVEYRLDASGTRYVRIFHNKNYESVLEGEIVETGVGLVLRKKLSRLGELFIFKKKKK